MVKRLLMVGLLTATSSACSITIHQRDVRTIESLEATAKNRAADARRVQNILARAVSETADPAPYEQAAHDLAALEAAEQARLAAAVYYERSKQE